MLSPIPNSFVRLYVDIITLLTLVLDPPVYYCRLKGEKK